jgi:hypothetical protein
MLHALFHATNLTAIMTSTKASLAHGTPTHFFFHPTNLTAIMTSTKASLADGTPTHFWAKSPHDVGGIEPWWAVAAPCFHEPSSTLLATV